MSTPERARLEGQQAIASTEQPLMPGASPNDVALGALRNRVLTHAEPNTQSMDNVVQLFPHSDEAGATTGHVQDILGTRSDSNQVNRLALDGVSVSREQDYDTADIRRNARRDHTRMSDDEQSHLVTLAQSGDKAARDKLWIDAVSKARSVALQYARDVHSLQDKIQICLEVVPRVINSQRSAGMSYSYRLHERMHSQMQDELRNEMHQHGLSRPLYAKLMAALKSEDPGAELHQLTQPVEQKDGKMSAGHVDARHFVKDGYVKFDSLYLETMTNPETGEQFTALLPGGMHDTTYEGAVRKVNEQQLRDVIKRLPEKERFVIVCANGLFGNPYFSRKQIAEALGVGQPRVTQILKKAQRRAAEIWEDLFGPIDYEEAPNEGRGDNIEEE